MLDFFLQSLNNSMDFKLQMGILLAIIGVHLSIFFLYVALFLLSVLPQVILCLGWCKCCAIFFFL